MIKIGMVKYGVVWYFIIRYGSYGYYGLVWHGMVSYWCEMVLYFSMVWYHMLIFMVWVVCYCMVSIAWCVMVSYGSVMSHAIVTTRCNMMWNVTVICFIVSRRGGWGDWTGWEICSESCGNGFQTRRRFCNNPTPAGNGLRCVGPEVETRSCIERQCQGTK